MTHQLTADGIAKKLVLGSRILAETTWQPTGAADAFGMRLSLEHDSPSIVRVSLEIGDVVGR